VSSFFATTSLSRWCRVKFLRHYSFAFLQLSYTLARFSLLSEVGAMAAT
jgi:hypothetical protein